MAHDTESDYEKMRREWDEPWELGYEPIEDWKPDYFTEPRDLFEEMEHQGIDPISANAETIIQFAVDNGYPASDAEELIEENEK